MSCRAKNGYPLLITISAMAALSSLPSCTAATRASAGCQRRQIPQRFGDRRIVSLLSGHQRSRAGDDFGIWLEEGSSIMDSYRGMTSAGGWPGPFIWNGSGYLFHRIKQGHSVCHYDHRFQLRNCTALPAGACNVKLIASSTGEAAVLLQQGREGDQPHCGGKRGPVFFQRLDRGGVPLGKLLRLPLSQWVELWGARWDPSGIVLEGGAPRSFFDMGGSHVVRRDIFYAVVSASGRVIFQGTVNDPIACPERGCVRLAVERCALFSRCIRVRAIDRGKGSFFDIAVSEISEITFFAVNGNRILIVGDLVDPLENSKYAGTVDQEMKIVVVDVKEEERVSISGKVPLKLTGSYVQMALAPAPYGFVYQLRSNDPAEEGLFSIRCE